MSEYTKEETLPCPKCKSLMFMELDHGSIVWRCPVHGENWQSDDTEIQAPRGRNKRYLVVRRRK